MLNLYFELLPFIDSKDEELAELLPHASSNPQLRYLLGLKDVKSVSEALQGSDVDLLDARVWFDGLTAGIVSDSPLCHPPSADIAHSPNSKPGCVHVLKGQAKRLTRAKAALGRFLVEPCAQDKVEDEEQADESASFVERLQKHRRLDEQQPSYGMLASIPPTSNIIERFFSIARTTY
ncbi:hypothetical protein PI124_g7436 [Phytophthora idaei]|nr:hypothetical protein PI124_g7436 [Phytophthora idaei]